MTIIRTRLLAAVSLALALSACNSFESRGYGWVARSKMTQPTPLYLPENAPSISQRFRPADGPADSNHRGFDIFVPTGTPVLAAAAGRVSRVSFSALYGRQVLVDHLAGSGERGLQTRYFHLSEQHVSNGDAVRRGQLLGYSGRSGLVGVFQHLHFEVHRLEDGDPPRDVGLLDPQAYWVDGVGRITCFDRRRDFSPAPLRLTYPVPCRGLDWE
jgi:murein DD-endopeptidase MepM/ murein hydrolase activator NlpD